VSYADDRVCNRCHNAWPHTPYYFPPSVLGGLAAWCKACETAAMARWRQSQLDHWTTT